MIKKKRFPIHYSFPYSYQENLQTPHQNKINIQHGQVFLAKRMSIKLDIKNNSRLTKRKDREMDIIDSINPTPVGWGLGEHLELLAIIFYNISDTTN